MTNTRTLNIASLSAAVLGVAALLLCLSLDTSTPSTHTRDASPYVRLSRVSPVNGDAPVSVTPPPCTEEDASGPDDAPVCRWDASTAGNGVGASYTAYPQSNGAVLFVYDSGEREYFDGGDPAACEGGEWLVSDDDVTGQPYVSCLKH